MSARTARQATVPAEETTEAGSQPELAVRWIFPMPCGRVTPLSARRVVLGREDDADVPLEGKETSRQHAEIRREGARAILRDLGSLNGTFLNGVRVREEPLAAGDVIRLGEWIGVVAPHAPAGSDGQTDGAPPEYASFAPGLFAGPALAPALDRARRVAAGTLPIVVEGETGTGKEGLCRALHAWSGRSGAFIAVNCGALPETLAEAELFGYRKGAFTGAERAQPGHFRAAHNGTLLLDEITDLPATAQVKLLRVLEQREVVPLGESTPVPIDVRVVAATQTPLAEVVRERRLRPDLAARLDGLTIRLPPLRERKGEIPFLLTSLLARHAAGARSPDVDPRLVERLCLYEWPFNVRELDLLVRQLLALYPDAPLLKRAFLPQRLLDAPGEPAEAPTRKRRRAPTPGELAALVAALKTTQGNLTRAAAQIGMSRQRAYRLMEQRTHAELEEIRAANAADPDAVAQDQDKDP
jgi:transcriptional regulator with AAA-type ATPase domain